MRSSLKNALTAGVFAAVALALATPASALPPSPPAGAPNKCLAGKIKAAIKKKACLLGVYSKAAGGGTAPDAAKVAKCISGFESAFTKLEAKGGCNVLLDAAAIEQKIDAFVLDVRDELSPVFPPSPGNKCIAGKLKCVIKLDSGLLNLYAGSAGKGVAIDGAKQAKVLAGFTDPVKGCFEKLEAKGGCATLDDTAAILAKDDAFITDLIEELVGAGAKDMNNQRCQGDTSIRCTVDGDCGGAAPCRFWFGTSLPLAAGGVPTCVTNQWNGGISGTANAETGASAGNASVVSRVYSGLLVDQPCPQCNGDPVQNDGAQGGICNGGARNGLACDADGTSPVLSFGVQSLDCPPAPGALIATLPIDLTNTNSGNSTITLSAASPNCRAFGFTGNECACDVCSLLSSKPCKSNADCGVGEGTCGGGSFGQPTAPNSCADATCSPTGSNEGECAAGPFDSVCSNEIFRGCLGDGDCVGGGTCITRTRECYLDNGVAGGSIVAVGKHSEAVGHASLSKFATTFCIAHTGSSAVNAAAGLPGPGRLELRGTGLDNGSSATCPTQFSFIANTLEGVLDTGWTGLGHDASPTSNGLVTVSVAGCANATPPCGVCTYSGPILNPNSVP